MLFRDVIGQEETKKRLIKQVQEGRQPHALLLTGPAGCGKLAMAAALGNYLLCQNKGNEDSCGECPACKQMKKSGHPDLHYSFPYIKKNESTTCEDYLPEWKIMIREGFYFDIDDWLDKMEAGNKQAKIFEKESDNILEQLGISAYEGGYKVMIIWLPERLHENAASNLLKFLEEPTPMTSFILVTEDVAKVMPTIVSRSQQVELGRLSTEVIARALEERNGLDKETARVTARLANGSYLNALKHIHINDVNKEYFELFVNLMRMAYARNLVGLQKWADSMASWVRDRQISFLNYAQNMVRENFIYNFHRPELNYMTEKESAFASKFARFINERNVVGFMEEMTRAQRDLEQNVNAKTVLFNFILKVTILIRR